MHSRILVLFLSIGALAFFGGCERHYWEDTRKLHMAHGGGDHDGHDSKAEHHEKGEGEKEGAHAKGDDHGKESGSGNHDKEAKAKPNTGDQGGDAEKPKGKPRSL